MTLHGAQSSDYVKARLREADLFIQHSITNPKTGDEEGLPVAILEAMSYGLPVVSTVHAGIPEAVIDGKTGFLVNEADCEGMAMKISTLATRPELRAAFGYAGWERAKSLFSWQRERERLLTVMGLS